MEPHIASKALKGIGSEPPRERIGALGKIRFNSMNNETSKQIIQIQIIITLMRNKNVNKLIEKLNTIDKKYLGPEVVEELKNFAQSGGRRKSRGSRRSRKLRKRNNKKSLKKKNRK